MSNSIFYQFPDSARFGRVISKSKIYQHATLTAKVKKRFAAQIEKIIWAYKLSPATINLPASTSVKEIQVFTVVLKTSELSLDVLRTIDMAIPSPILFMLSYNGKYRYAAAYKRPSEADRSRWVISSYFQSDWMNGDTEKIKLPVVLNMGALYQSFLESLCPLNFRKGESLDNLVSRVDQSRVKEGEALRLENRIKREKQFNRRVELNRTLNELKAEIQSLNDK